MVVRFMSSIPDSFCDKYVAKVRPISYAVALALGLLGASAPAMGQTVILTPVGNNLYNTGFAGTVPAGANQIDTHYSVTNYNVFGGAAYQSAPTQPHWIPDASTPGSQWVTVVPHLVPTNTPPAPFATATFDYQLTLTNIPIGAVVTINGAVAADDSAVLSVNGKAPVFSNFHTFVSPANYMAQTPFAGLSFVAGASNVLTIAVSNIGGGPTGLNLALNGSYTALTTTVGLGIVFAPPVPLTPNQNAVLNNINQINVVGSANTCFANLVASLLVADPNSFGADLDQLSPEKLAIFSSIAFNDASFETSNFDDYTAHRRNHEGNLQVTPGHVDTSGLTYLDPTMDPTLAQAKSRLLAWSPAPTPGLLSDSGNPLMTDFLGQPTSHNDPADNWNFFVSGDVVLGQNYSQTDLEHTNYTTSSFQIGSDYQFGDHFMAGVLFDYGHTDTALDEQGSSATIDSYSPGVFASYAQNGWFANFLGLYSKNAYTEQRVIGFGTYAETANGTPDGDQETANLDGGYEFHSRDKHWTFGPTSGVQYTHLNIDSFDETGGCSSDLNVDYETADSLRSRFGGRVSYAKWDDSNRTIFTPYIDASWQHEWLGGDRNITSNFREVSNIPFTVSTPNTSRDSALLVAGMNADITKDMTLFTNYAVQVGQSDYFGQSVMAGLKIGF